MMITIIDYGMGNLGSIHNMFKYIGVASEITDNHARIAAADKILLPGVGAFDTAMQRIRQDGLQDLLNQKALVERIPIMGICLGMQLLTRGSEEGKLPGLGWIAADTKRLVGDNDLKVPHMGWNVVNQTRYSPLTQGLATNARFYFVHSYAVHVDDPQDAVLDAVYGIKFDVAVQKDNIFGAQFHPEKSHKFGMQLLRNFAGL